MTFILFSILALFSSFANAGSIDEQVAFKSLDQSKSDKIHKELSALFTHTTASPGNTLGDYWGVEVGVVFTGAKTPEIDFQRENYGNLRYATNLENPTGVSRAGALARFSLGRLLVEATYLPEYEGRDFLMESKSAGFLINIIKDAKFFMEWDISLKGHFSKSSAISNQTGDRSDPGKMTYETEVKGALLIISSNQYSFQPFFGIGKAKSTGNINFAATNSGGTIFDQSSSLVGKTTLDLNESSSHFLLGFQSNFLYIVNASVEVALLFGTQVTTVKLSLEI